MSRCEIVRVDVRRLAMIALWMAIFISVIGWLVAVVLQMVIYREFSGDWEAFLYAQGLNLLLGVLGAGITGLIGGVLLGCVSNRLVVRVTGPLRVEIEGLNEAANLARPSRICRTSEESCGVA